ncbi:MAG TPA: UbiH/UbiF family hydroxylase [Beijerinckiaceae bacterium]|jgi:2-octaprenyl-6-methoxyphenol hydroxylase|nr:UbiH/UbiF family hydroxylase [Beijerinckiaceae bacterium]
MDANILIAGAGPAGLAACLALARLGKRVVVAGPADDRLSARTVALFDGSVRFLAALGVWDRIAPRAAPLATMRIVDDTGSLFAHRPTDFKASETGLEQFGFNIENADLTRALEAALAEEPNVRRRHDLVTGYDFEAECCRVGLANGETIEAHLVVAADGRASPARAAAGIGVREWAYPQVAFTALLDHAIAHGDASTEFHTREGPCTFVPLPATDTSAHRSSLVWMMRPAHADQLRALSDADLARAIEKQSHHLLGKITLARRGAFIPIQGLTARAMTAPRLALVGEAAHVFPPIGAQGLNLGLRDVAHLAEYIERLQPEDAGAPHVLDAYERARHGDVLSRQIAVDLLDRTLLAGFLPVDILRAAGMAALTTIAPLRRFAMREGVLPGVGAPDVMRQPYQRAQSRPVLPGAQ